ncbi:MAG: hypothetical protein JW754_02630 [Candidatus Aenigmarchaeota archaeon]|nr:hypothetical protein [Candidatus Aenigmarchaeota archaeon]
MKMSKSAIIKDLIGDFPDEPRLFYMFIGKPTLIGAEIEVPSVYCRVFSNYTEIPWKTEPQ